MSLSKPSFRAALVASLSTAVVVAVLVANIDGAKPAAASVHSYTTIRYGSASVPLGLFGLRFEPQPSSQAGTTEEQAIATATSQGVGVRSSGGGLLPNVTVNAQYGLFWDDRSTTVSASGVSKLDYQDIPVWLVTFSGELPNINLGGALGAPQSGPRPAYAPAGHTENVVIDASSGSELFQFG